MANTSKLKKLRKTLGAAPKIENASTNLNEPEIANSYNTPNSYSFLDGRSIRKTNRTVRFATCVTPQFNELLRKIAIEKKMLLSEVLEEALNLYYSQMHHK